MKINPNWFRGSGLKANLERKFEAAGLFIKSNAKDLAPYDTGNLRGSIESDTEWESEYVIVTKIGTNVDYAWFVEFGTGKYSPEGRKTAWMYKDEEGNWHRTAGMRAQPFLFPAIDLFKPLIKRIIRTA